MRAFSEWWRDERHDTPCCWFEQDDELLEQACEEFDCATCPVPAKWATLGPLNSHAWATYRTASTRLTGEAQAAGPVLVKLLEPLDAEEFADAWQRVSLIHDIVCPKREPKGS